MPFVWAMPAHISISHFPSVCPSLLASVPAGSHSISGFWVTKGLSVAIALVEHPLLGAMRVEGLCWRGGFAG